MKLTNTIIKKKFRRTYLSSLAFCFFLFGTLTGVDAQNPNIISKNGTTRKIEQSKNKEIKGNAQESLLENKKSPAFDINTINKIDALDEADLDSIINALTEIIEENKRLAPSKIYGHQIFREAYKISQDKESDLGKDIFTMIAKIPDSYILGAGDKLTVSIFGASQLDAQLEINSKGYVQPDRLPKLFLKGLTWVKAKKLIQNRFNQFYSFNSDQFAISLSKPRTITVNIFGEVEKPGSYNLSAVNTAFNALVVAGGPTEGGSVRNIKIITDKQQQTFDVYEFMNNPGIQSQYFLEDNAIIQIPPAQKIVKISGAVQRPLKYELKDNEDLKTLIDYAGGLRPDAYQEIVQIQRFANNQQQLLDINWQELLNQRQSFNLENGDGITIRAIPNLIKDIVSIEGAVELPGTYSLQSTPRVSALLIKGRLDRQARLDVAFLIRTKLDETNQLIQLNLNEIITEPGATADLLLEPGDKLLISAESKYADRFSIKVKGAVRDNIEYALDRDSSITVQQAVLLAGGLMPEATDFGYLIRTNATNKGEKEYVRIDVKTALANPESTANLRLRPLDELVILEASSYTNIANVAIRGAVRFPGEFQYDASLKLKDVLTLAGGFTPEAALNRLEVYRLEISENQPTKTIITTLEVDENFNMKGSMANFVLQPYDEIIVRAVPNFERTSFVQLDGEVLFPGEYALTQENETLSNLIRRAGGLTTEAFPEGAKIWRDSQFVVTELNQALSKQNSAFDLILLKGDKITIPKREDLVFLNLLNTGAFELYPEKFTSKSSIGVTYTPNKSAKWYLEEYLAGFGTNAAKTKVTVEYPNGAIKGTKNIIGIFKIYPKPVKGAAISIGRKPMKELSAKDKEALKTSAKERKGAIITLSTEEEGAEK